MTAEQFKQTVMPLKDVMFRIAFSILGSEADALDAIQETLISLWTNRQRLATSANAQAYCIGSLKNQCISAMRRRKESTPIAEALRNASDNDATSHAIDARDSIRLMQSIIAHLPEGQRRVIRLSAFAQLSNDEIAQATGYSEQNVRTLLSRARRKIKELFTLHSPIL